jgi:tRNA(Ile)-lysidine synthase
LARPHERNASLNAVPTIDIDALVERSPLLTETNDRVVIGCSGGTDSVGLVALAAHAGRDAVVVYIDHGLRSDSAADFAVVRAAAQRFGMAAVMIAIELSSDSSNLEARARDARFGALETFRRDADAQAVWLGHTMDDQAETVLLAMLRGSGLAGMSGMAPQRGAIQRPLLGLRRGELQAVCHECKLTTLEDPMNFDPRFRRVWVRRELLPSLNAHAERDLAPVLARQAQIVRADHEYLERLAADVLRDAGSQLRVETLRLLDAVIARRVLRQFIGEPPIGGKHVEAALAVVYGDRVSVELPNRRTLRRSGGILFVDATPRLTE